MEKLLKRGAFNVVICAVVIGLWVLLLGPGIDLKSYLLGITVCLAIDLFNPRKEVK